MIIIAGRNFFAEDVESVVRGVVGHGRCVALADVERERIMVAVEAADAASAADLSTEVRRAVSTALDLGAVEVHVVPRNTLARTTSGKWQRARMTRLLSRTDGR